MSKLRFDVVQDAFKKRALDVTAPAERPSAYFGELVFNREKMHKYLDVKTYEALVDCIDNGRSLDLATADKVAEGMKEWALEHGVTHITHWFQPLTEVTAEKHDSLMEYDRKGGMIESFNGKSLIQQEPDASSFPSGGIRATFEARGYTAWDPTSPVFIQDDTLCIPTVFISYTGEALDYKTPLKKALKAVSDAAVPICKLFDPKVSKVHSYLGWEQEYFLVDEDLYAARPDLILTGRTLMGHASSKNQQLEDHYFAAIPTRVAAFMKDLEYEGYKLGIPLKTRHNEVAPNQFELAPIFGECNLSNDQNQMIMNVMNKVARKHGFVVLLHEKPFDGINGSGKHNNWSLGTDTGTLLLAPGKDPAGNLQFVTFFVNILAAVQKHNALLKASIASATNAHRLEFRAVGSSANCAGAMTALSGAVAEQLLAFKKNIDKELASGKALEVAIMDTLKPIISSIIDVVCFDGNGYTDEWKEEAARRGLDTETSVPEMIKSFTTPASVEMFTSLGIYTTKELEARNEVKWEMYTKKVQIESRVMGRMAINHVIPAALAYQNTLLKNLTMMKENFPDSYQDKAAVTITLIEKISHRIEQLQKGVAKMIEARKSANTIENEYEKAKAYHEIAESLFAIRRPIDKLEEIVDNDMWPLPKYRELLFIN